jgi:conjugal transfer pilus assembly protein TraL
MEPVVIPTHLDAPKRMLFWTVDQVVPFAVLFVIGMMAGKLFLGIVGGVVLSWMLEKYKNSRSDGLMQHFAYWYGIVPLSGRAAINPFHRRIYPA